MCVYINIYNKTNKNLERFDYRKHVCSVVCLFSRDGHDFHIARIERSKVQTVSAKLNPLLCCAIQQKTGYKQNVPSYCIPTPVSGTTSTTENTKSRLASVSLSRCSVRRCHQCCDKQKIVDE